MSADDTATMSEPGTFVKSRSGSNEPESGPRADSTSYPSEYILHWEIHKGGAYAAEVRLSPEEEGGYSARVPMLPGVVSEGETEEQTISNVSEALSAVIESYLKEGESVPWDHGMAPLEPGEIRRWIVVNVKTATR